MSVPQGRTITLSQHYFPSLRYGKYNLPFEYFCSPAYLFTKELLVDNVYDYFIN